MSKTFKFAFVKTIPVMLGYLFLGLAFGLLLQEAGYSFWWALLISTVVYVGSIQFVLVGFLTAGTSLPVVAVMTLLINSPSCLLRPDLHRKIQGHEITVLHDFLPDR